MFNSGIKLSIPDVNISNNSIDMSIPCVDMINSVDISKQCVEISNACVEVSTSEAEHEIQNADHVDSSTYYATPVEPDAINNLQNQKKLFSYKVYNFITMW